MAEKNGTTLTHCHASRAVQRWILSLLVGVSVGVGIIALWPFHRVPLATQSLVGISFGWITALMFAPWKSMFQLTQQRQNIGELAGQLKRMNQSRRDTTLRSLLEHDQDALTELREVLHDVLTQSVSHRIQANCVSRTMDHEVEKRTRVATAKLTKDATTDPLTGLGNRRRLDHFLKSLKDRTSTEFAFVTALTLDIDLFKPVNDELGHDIGDTCLVFLADILKSSVRGNDCAARLGGDEFIILMPGLPSQRAAFVAERITKLFSQMPWIYEQPAQPTLSIGVAEADLGSAFDPDALLRRADEALYAAKRAGRSCVRTHAQLRGAA